MKKLLACSLGLFLTCASATAVADRVFQTSEMLSGPDMDPALEPNGAAWLRRTPKRVDGRVMVKVDNADLAYTIWWVIFNRPENCATNPCQGPDLFNPSVKAAVFNASGAISAAAGDGGVINVDVEIVAGEGSNKGHAPFPVDVPFPGADLNGVLKRRNGCGAEIHMDVNEHSDFDEGWVTELTQPEGLTHRFAIFPAVDCRKNRNHDDDDSSD